MSEKKESKNTSKKIPVTNKRKITPNGNPRKNSPKTSVNPSINKPLSNIMPKSQNLIDAEKILTEDMPQYQGHMFHMLMHKVSDQYLKGKKISDSSLKESLIKDGTAYVAKEILGLKQEKKTLIGNSVYEQVCAKYRGFDKNMLDEIFPDGQEIVPKRTMGLGQTVNEQMEKALSENAINKLSSSLKTQQGRSELESIVKARNKHFNLGINTENLIYDPDKLLRAYLSGVGAAKEKQYKS